MASVVPHFISSLSLIVSSCALYISSFRRHHCMRLIIDYGETGEGRVGGKSLPTDLKVYVHNNGNRNEIITGCYFYAETLDGGVHYGSQEPFLLKTGEALMKSLTIKANADIPRPHGVTEVPCGVRVSFIGPSGNIMHRSVELGYLAQKGFDGSKIDMMIFYITNEKLSFQVIDNRRWSYIFERARIGLLNKNDVGSSARSQS